MVIPAAVSVRSRLPVPTAPTKASRAVARNIRGQRHGRQEEDSHRRQNSIHYSHYSSSKIPGRISLSRGGGGLAAAVLIPSNEAYSTIRGKLAVKKNSSILRRLAIKDSTAAPQTCSRPLPRQTPRADGTTVRRSLPRRATGGATWWLRIPPELANLEKHSNLGVIYLKSTPWPVSLTDAIGVQ